MQMKKLERKVHILSSTGELWGFKEGKIRAHLVFKEIWRVYVIIKMFRALLCTQFFNKNLFCKNLEAQIVEKLRIF